METTQLKSYAPAARTAFIAAVKSQAAKVGVSAKGTAKAEVKGDLLLVEGQAFPRGMAEARTALVKRVDEHGFEPTMEAIAYTWFNRFAAIRYMELHGYLDHGFRVLSHPENTGRPEILDHAADVELKGLDRQKALELKLDGTKDEELYRLLLLAQCNALHDAMPFLFEKIGDETELLLPANLLHSDSLIQEMVESVDEELWHDIEIVGWLYQFYISDKKKQVMKKVVKPQDIPAATQLFTPNWIVKYMVQNSLGAQWVATYPNSPLEAAMEYYIEPATQTDEVNAQIAAITPSQLDPEELTLMDPACGSGHILVEAYELFKAIYLERGYRQRDVPQLILEKNLFGLDIDARAAQMAGFALMMKGRADDRRLLERGVKLNVLTIVDSASFDSDSLASGLALVDYGLTPKDLSELKRLFEHATTFGSLITVPEWLAPKLPALKHLGRATSQDLFLSEDLRRLVRLVQQAEALAAKYDAVVANPPYMGRKHMSARVKKFAETNFPKGKSDLFACFMIRAHELAKPVGREAMVTMQTWMFLPSFQKMREELLKRQTLETMTQIGFNSFPSLNSKVALATVFSLASRSTSGYTGSFVNLNSAHQSADKKKVFLNRGPSICHTVSADEFRRVPGSPIAYWISDQTRRVFEESESAEQLLSAKKGMDTGSNDTFLRLWHEIDTTKAQTSNHPDKPTANPRKKWIPYNKGGPFRRWYGNHYFVVNWSKDGRDIRSFGADTGSIRSTVRNEEYHFRPSVSWTDISIVVSARSYPSGFIHDNSGPSAFGEKDRLKLFLGLMTSPVAPHLLAALNPTLHFQIGNVKKLPFRTPPTTRAALSTTEQCILRSKNDWDDYERSWNFQRLPFVALLPERTPALKSTYLAWIARSREAIAEMKRLEEENNRLFIDAYGLQDELTPEVPIEQITLTVNPAYRYGGKLTEEEQWTRFREDAMEELVSYAIGCMMGRYSLDTPGLIYAHSGNRDFDPTKYTTFPADDDGIVPVTDTAWFEDDACNRFVEFISVAWDPEHLEANLTFVAENLSPKKNESSRETIRRWLCNHFFKDHHLKRYKKRPIYWLFSSGKLRAFQCLVYLHRYNEGTLARMRSEYVIPLQGKLTARIDQLEGDIQVATSAADRNRRKKELAKLKKQEVELLTFDEKLRHYADRRISLDLDDGVKVNYGKFGELLAEVKAVHGKKPETA